MILDIDGGTASSKSINCYFDLKFQHATTGFPEGITFNLSKFVRPNKSTGTGLALLAQAVAANKLLNKDDKKENPMVINMENSSQ